MEKPATTMVPAAIVAGIVASFLWSELRRESEEVADLRGHLSELENAGKVSAAATPSTSPSLPCPTEPLLPGPCVSGAAAAHEQGGSTAIAQSRAGAVRSGLSTRFRDLSKELNLSPAEAEQFLDLIDAQYSRSANIFFGKSMDGKTPDEIRLLFNEQLRKDELEQAQMLGGKYSQWPIYENKVSARILIGELRSLLGTGDNTMTDAQAAALETAMGFEIAQVTRGRRERPITTPVLSPIETTARNQEERNLRIVDVASSYLTASQLDAFRTMLARQVESDRAADARMGRVRAIQDRLEANP